jgi:hypothetical protein
VDYHGNLSLCGDDWYYSLSPHLKNRLKQIKNIKNRVYNWPGQLAVYSQNVEVTLYLTLPLKLNSYKHHHYWVCVIFFACVCVWVRQIRQLRLTIPTPRSLPCAPGAFLGGSQGGFGIYKIPKKIVYIVWRMVKFDIMKIRKVFPVEGFR